MAQIIYLGIESDFTQESGLLASKVGSKARVVEGLGISVATDTQNNVILVMQPGIFVMPDGMVVKETEVVKLPLVNLDSTGTGYTLVAKRYAYDIVYYDLVKGEHFQDTLFTALKDSDPDLVAMPLSFVYKADSTSSLDSPALYYTVRDLGARGSASYNYLPCPVANLYQEKIRLDVKTSLETPVMLFHTLQPSIITNPIRSFLPVTAGPNEFLKAVFFKGRRDRKITESPAPVKVLLRVTSQYLQGLTQYASKACQELEYTEVLNADGSYRTGSDSLTLRTFVYPTGSKITKDLLTIEVINLTLSTQERVTTTPFNLNEIIISTLGIFG